MEGRSSMLVLNSNHRVLVINGPLGLHVEGAYTASRNFSTQSRPNDA